MEYQKVTNLIDNISDQASKFRRKSLVKINDDSCRKQNTDSQIKFKTLTQSSLCDYSDAYILVIVYIYIYTRDNYSKTSRSLWQYYRDEPTSTLTKSESFKSKVKITRKTPADGNKKNTEIALSLKYLSNSWRTLEMPLISCEINLNVTCQQNTLFLIEQAK